MNTTQAITVQCSKAQSDAECRREHRYASDAAGRAIDLQVTRLGRKGVRVTKGVKVAGFSVNWNARTTVGWHKGWCKRFGTEAEALAFAAEKWSLLMVWLDNQKAVAS